MQGGVVACLFSFSVCLSLSLYVHLPLYFFLFSFSHTLSCARSLEAAWGRQPTSQSSKSGFKCSHTQVRPTGTIPPSHLAVKVEGILCMRICVRRVCLCVSAVAASRQAYCSALLLQPANGSSLRCDMYYAKARCADTFKNRQLQSSVRLTSAPSFSVCWAGGSEEAERKEEISELQVETERPKTRLHHEGQELQRKVSGLLIDRRHMHKHIWMHVYPHDSLHSVKC